MTSETKKAYNKQWAITNQDKLRAYRKAYYRNSRKPPSVRTRYSRMLHDAKDRNLPVTLTFAEYETLQARPCFYCEGTLPVQGSGLDRIDSTLGYISGNVRPCCKSCNYAKSDLTESQFKEWIQRVFTAWVCK